MHYLILYTGLQANTTYYWRITFTNGEGWVSSAVSSFTTRLRDCSSVPCVSGTCDQETLKCDCDYGWSGDDCSIAPVKHGLLCLLISWINTFSHLKKDHTKLIIGVVVGVGGFLICLVLLVSALLIRNRRKKVKLLMPDFTKYMFTPGISVKSLFT